MFSLGSHQTWHFEVLLWILTLLSPISFHSIREFLKDLSLVLFSSFFTPPPSVLLSLNSSCGHHLYADDTQLFISFTASDFSTIILRLQATIDLVSNWMSSNLLSLNQAKTEFLPTIGLPAQLSKIADPTLLSMPSNVTIMPADSARNLGIIFDSTLSMSHHISSVSKSCFSSIRAHLSVLFGE